MKIERSYRIELDPNNRQKTLLEGHGHAARFAYNWGLQRWQEAYEQGEKTNAMKLHKELVVLKDHEFSWLRSFSKCAPQEALRDLQRAYQNFFRRVKSGVKPGFPKFKSRHRCPLKFRLYGSINIERRRIKLPNIGWVRLKEADYLPAGAHVKAATVRQVAGRWFVSVLVEEEIADPAPTTDQVVGVDLGVSHMATCSDGTVYENPKPLKKLLYILSKLSKRLSRKQKRSRNRQKAKARIQRIHYRISCIRKDALHKATTEVVRTKRPAVVVLEDLNVSGMQKNRSLARAISDVGMNEFRRQVEYKAKLEGVEVVVVDRFFPSSKTCNVCGAIHDMPLQERTYKCSVCNHVEDRDLNAAKNLAKIVTVSSTGSACGEDVRPSFGWADLNEAGSRQKAYA